MSEILRNEVDHEFSVSCSEELQQPLGLCQRKVCKLSCLETATTNRTVIFHNFEERACRQLATIPCFNLQPPMQIGT